MKWLKRLLGTNTSQTNTNNSNSTDIQSLVKASLDESDKILAEFDDSFAQIQDLSEEELAWTDWFMSLPEEHKKLVEISGYKGIKVTPDNFDSVLEKTANAYS